jgi:predicted O-linked N-acetylglucosamine transferase (SPINDLY family)
MSSAASPQQLLQAALQHHQAGQLDEAERLYRQLLGMFPGQPDVTRNLGLVLHQKGNHAGAVELLDQSIRAKPDVPNAHNNLGEALRALGRVDEAISRYRVALRLNPNYPEALNNLGAALLQKGETEAGVAELRRALSLRPDYARAMLNLGGGLIKSGKLAEGMKSLREAARLMPNFPPAHATLGQALLGDKRPDEAIQAFQAALRIDPKYPDALNGLGAAQRLRGRWAEAIEAHSAAAACGPADDPAPYAGLAECYLENARFSEAADALHTAIARRPNDATYHNALGEVLRKAGLVDAATRAYERALELDPKLAAAHNNLALALATLGEYDDALPMLRRAVELDPAKAEFHANLLMALNYVDGQDPRSTFEEHARWGRLQAPPAMTPLHARCAGDDPERRLRVGIVSPDLRDHPVAAFLEPLLASLDRSRFGVVAFSDTRRADDVTPRLRALCEGWHDTVGVTDDVVAAQVVAEKLDVLIDLAGHTADNRLTLFARRAAPVQVTYLGYPNTTGVESIGYRITDAIADPPGESDALHTEKLLRLPRCFLCYRPPDAAPEVTPSPCAANPGGGITFGALNNPAKVSPGALRAWAEVLRALPDARLLLKGPGLQEEAADRRARERLAAHGLPLDRVELVGQVASRAEFLGTFGRVDVALDTFPYNGTTTTCEALWMGVPVLTYAGRVHAARVSASLLTAAGLPELVAASPESYVKLACDLAGDRARLAELRATMRDRLRASPLMDAASHARAVEAALREAWRTACATKSEIRGT